MDRCFSCEEVTKCTDAHVRKPFDYRGAYFPIFERFHPPSKSAESTVKVCDLCYILLLSQWQSYERQGVLESRRVYFTKRLEIENSSNKAPLSVTSNSSFVDIQNDKNDLICEAKPDINNKDLTEHHICCFVCGLPCLKWHAKTAYSSQVLENKEYFPFFEKLESPELSIGITNGATKICVQCESDLLKQWEHYESLGTDQIMRTYHITNEHNSPFSITNPGRFITNSMVSNTLFTVFKMKNSTIKCAICPNKVIDPYTVSWSHRASCLFISSLRHFTFPSEGIIIDKQSEEAVICDVCHYFLSYQMQAYNAAMTPNHLREYKLPKVGSLPAAISFESDKRASNSRKSLILGCSSSAFSAPDERQQTNSQSKPSRSLTVKSQSKTATQFSESNRINSNLSVNAINVDQSNVFSPIVVGCHVCLHEFRGTETLRNVSSISSAEFPDQAFFPFLKTLRMNSAKSNEFPVCAHCYANLHGQWRIFQKATVPIYDRNYSYHEYMCAHCQHLFAQKNDVMIVQDRLLCIPCSENKVFETRRNGTSANNQNLFESAVSSKSILNGTSGPVTSELYQQYSKTLFSKNNKRPIVAAIAPNQRQNMPNKLYESITAHSDLRPKVQDVHPLSGHSFNHGGALNSFSGISNYPMSVPPSNSAFSLHPSYLANVSNGFCDQKHRINTVQTSNPFMNWTQQQRQPDKNGISYSQSLPHEPLDPPFAVSSKESEMAMMLYMMYRKQMNLVSDPSNKFANNWLNNNQSLEDLAWNYQQPMMSQTLNYAVFPTEDMLPRRVTNSDNDIFQSYMMNAAIANYQYTNMMQILTAYQQNTTSKLATNWFNQMNIQDPSLKRAQPDSMIYDQQSHAKAPTNNNGYIHDFNLMMYSEWLKSSTGNESEKILNGKHTSINLNSSCPTNPSTVDSRSINNCIVIDDCTESLERLKMSKQAHGEQRLYKIKESSTQSTPGTNGTDSKMTRKTKLDTKVLDLSQIKIPYKSSYAIDSLTELTTCCDVDTQNLDTSWPSSNNEEFHPSDILIDNSQVQPSQDEHARFMVLLNSINAPSLINVFKIATLETKNPISQKPSLLRYAKCPTSLKVHKFLNRFNYLCNESENILSSCTRRKSEFLMQCGLKSTLKNGKNLKETECYIMQQINKSTKMRLSVNGRFWKRWVSRNLQKRLSAKVKPHLRRSLMRPVISGDIEVKLCVARNRHELESLRSIIKILKRHT